MAPGAFLVLAFVVAFINKLNINKAKKNGTTPKTCRLDECEGCPNVLCSGKVKED